MSVPSLGNCVPEWGLYLPIVLRPSPGAELTCEAIGLVFSACNREGHGGLQGKVHRRERKRSHLDQRCLVPGKRLLSSSLGSSSSLRTPVAEAAARAHQANSGGFMQGLRKA